MSELYMDVINYVEKLLEKQKMFFEVRGILDNLFIEKIEFMLLERHAPLIIFREIVGYNDSYLIRRFKATTKKGILTPILTKFNYICNYDKMLIYIIWKDAEGNKIKPQSPGTDNFRILKEEDTYTIN